MTTIWKTVRIFISSTFRDMQAERDHLVRFVFPKLPRRSPREQGHLVQSRPRIQSARCNSCCGQRQTRPRNFVPLHLETAAGQRAATHPARRKRQAGVQATWSDGTTSIELSPLALIARLAALVPPPRRNLDLLKGKRLVIWVFAERDLRFGMKGWEKIELEE